MTLENRHISSLFENDLETIQAHIVKMGGLVEVAIIDATKSFARKDIKLAKQVKKRWYSCWFFVILEDNLIGSILV